MQQTRTLLCFVHGKGSEWEAICTDYDISVEGKSLREAQEHLFEAVRTYLLDVRDLDDAAQNRLLSRRSPLHVRLKLACMAFMTSARHKLGNPSTKEREERGTFNLLCPV